MLPARLVDPKTGRAVISTATRCGRLLVVAGEDGAVRIWDMRHRLFVNELKRREGGITSLASNSSVLFTGSRDGSIIAWDIKDWCPKYKLHGFSAGIKRLACNENTLVYLTLVFGTTGMVDTRTRQRLTSVWEARGSSGNTIDFGITETMMVTTTDEGEIHLWDLGKHKLLRSFKSEGDFPIACIDGQLLAYADGVNGIVIVETTSRRVIARLEVAVPATMYCLELHNEYLAAGFDDGSAIFWRRGTWTIVRTHRRHDDPVVAIVFIDTNVFVVHENGLIDILKSSNWRWIGKLENRTPSIDEKLAARDAVIGRLNKQLADGYRLMQP